MGTGFEAQAPHFFIMSWYLYIARCGDGSLYTGVTTDPAARMTQHNAGRGSAYVRSRRSAALAYVERCRGHSAALRREAEIKRWPRAKKLDLVNARARRH